MILERNLRTVTRRQNRLEFFLWFVCVAALLAFAILMAVMLSGCDDGIDTIHKGASTNTVRL